MEENFDFHFIAIGGVGQSALAKILLQLGYKVSGSDISDSKYIKLVSSFGAKVFIGHSEKNIIGKPKIVISSAIKEDNVEIKKAKELGLEILHRSDCLKLISKEFPIFIGTSGTHGKTTTSGMISFILEKINENPSFAIGGIIPKININAKADRNSKYFVAELDESDGTIQKYAPDYLVINNLEADHLDYYKNGLDDILDTFNILVNNMDENSKIFLNIDDDGCNLFKKRIKTKNIITYSINSNSDYIAKNIAFSEFKSSFEVYKKDKFLAKVNLIIPGVHNVYNALAIISVLDNLGYDINSYKDYFAEFSGMGRRFQIVYDKNNTTIIDDYAHHPKEIQSTLNSIQNTNRRKIAIFQPHRYTRLRGLWSEFLDSFNNIDELYILDVFNAGDKFDENYNSKIFTEEIIKKGINAKYVEGNMENVSKIISKDIIENFKDNNIILTLGAGDITKLGGLIGNLLSK